MKEHGTVRPSIAREFHAALVSLSPDFDDYQMEYIIGAKGVLRKAIREALADAVPELRNLYTLAHDGMRHIENLLEIGRFETRQWKHILTSENFPMEPHEPKTRTIVLVKIDHHNSTREQVLYEFERRGLKCPTYEDALYFGIEYADEIEQDIVFLHEPQEVYCSGHNRTLPRVITLGKGRNLYLSRECWVRDTFFAAVVE